MPRPAKRARRASTSPGPSASPPVDTETGRDDGETSASHLVSFLTGYADHHSSASSGSDGEGEGEGDEFNAPSEGEEEDIDVDEEEERATPRRIKGGLIGSPTPRKGGGTPRRRGSKTPGNGTGATPKRKKPDLGFGLNYGARLNSELQDEEGPEGGGIIRPSRADAYFLAHSRASRSSGNSYSSLAPPLSQKAYESYLSHSSSSRNKLVPPESFEGQYDQWIAELGAGFNLLFYGFGSKRTALNRFVKDRLARLGHAVVVNGHFPQLGIRDVLAQIEDSVAVPQDIPVPPTYTYSTPLDRSAYRIYAHFLPSSALLPPSSASAKRSSAAASASAWHKVSSAPLYLLVHNIDSASLRSPRALSILSLLASSPRIHILATFDHLHTPLIFSSSLSSSSAHTYSPGSWTGHIPPERGFNWVHHNLTTYQAYTVELSYLRLSAASHLSLAGGTASGGGISEEGALQILRSVPPMAARLLKLLLLRQLSNLPADPASHTAHPAAQVAPAFALDNDILQTLAREKFIAREEERYNALIGEYRDHGLVVDAPVDGEGRTGKWIWVPLGKAAVERVLETMSEVEI